MDIAFTVRLPIDTDSVPFVRGLCRLTLEHLRVPQSVVDEIVLALTEACANVVQHAGDSAEYEVQVQLDDAVCRISVVDDGTGFDPRARPAGGGLMLMQALVDRLAFHHESDGRHRVTLEKRLDAHPPLRLVDPA